MSLSRTALRLAAIEALAPAALLGTGQPYPTAAGANVFDTRIDPIAAADDWETFLLGIEGTPIITVFTEEQETIPKPGSDYHAEVEMIDLVVELMIAARGELTVQGPDGADQTVGFPMAPITDRDREGMLDGIEEQVRRLLNPTRLMPSNGLFLKTAWNVEHKHSVPQRSVEGAQKVAARTLKFRIKVASTEWPPEPVIPVATGINVLPQPLLAVALALPVSSSAYQTCLAIANIFGPPAAIPPLTDIRLYIQDVLPGSPIAPPSHETVAAEQAPYDIQADVPLP